MSKCKQCGSDLPQKEVKETKIEIKNRWTGDVIYSSKKETIKEAVVEAVENGADLSEADLSGANLYEANLSKANLYEANLSKANLSKANLSKANLYEANLSKANLSKANLSGANLYEADLYGAKFYGKGGTQKLTKEQVPDFLKALGFEIE